MMEQLMPLHPKLVHFPIALFITALILDLLSRIFRKENLHQAAVIVYLAGVFFAPIVVWAGLWEQQRLNLHHPVLEQHKLYAFITLWVSLASIPLLWFLKKKFVRLFRIVFTSLLLLMAVLVTTTGYFGGRMVYEYGAGIIP